jgi:hypothetical protein
VGAPCADPAALAVSQCPQVPRATEDLQPYLDGFVTEMAANAGAPTDAMRDALRKAVLDFVGGPDADCCQSVLSVFAWLQKMIEGATMSATAAIVALDSTSAARHHAALRLFTEVLWHPVSRHRVRGPDGQARILQACAALVKALVAVLAHAATSRRFFITLDVYYAAESCSKVLYLLSHDAACWPILLEARALYAINASADIVADVLKPWMCLGARNEQHIAMLSHAITMITNMLKAPGDLDLSLYTASKVVLVAVRKYHCSVASLVVAACECCISVFARALKLDHVVEAELEHETNFMMYFETLANLVFHRWDKSAVAVGAAQTLVRMMLDAAASKHAVALVDLVVFALTEERPVFDQVSESSPIASKVLEVLIDGFAEVLPVIEQFDEGDAVRRLLTIVQWFVRTKYDMPVETAERKARSLGRFVPTMTVLMRKYSTNLLVAAECCDALFPFGHMCDAVVDLKLFAPVASVITDVIVSIGCNLVGFSASYRNNFLWSGLRVMQALVGLEKKNASTVPSVTLPAVQPLCSLAVQLVRRRKHEVGYIIEFFMALSSRGECHDALRSKSQGYLDGLTGLLHVMHAIGMDALVGYERILNGIYNCLWKLYEHVECFSAEDVACLSYASCALRLFFRRPPTAELFEAKAQLAQTQHRRWTDLRMSWVGAVAQHQAQLHDTLRAAELELQAALAEEEDEDADADADADADVVTAPAHKLARRA